MPRGLLSSICTLSGSITWSSGVDGGNLCGYLFRSCFARAFSFSLCFFIFCMINSTLINKSLFSSCTRRSLRRRALYCCSSLLGGNGSRHQSPHAPSRRSRDCRNPYVTVGEGGEGEVWPCTRFVTLPSPLVACNKKNCSGYFFFSLTVESFHFLKKISFIFIVEN